MAAKSIISITMPPDMLARIDELAEAQGLPRSQVILNCVRDTIEDQEVATRMMGNPSVREGFFRIFQNREILKAFASELISATDQSQLELFAKSLTRTMQKKTPAAKPVPPASAKKGRKK